MSVYAKAYDGSGWYIIEVDENGGHYLRDMTRFGTPVLAIMYATRNFPRENCIALWWDGRSWGETA